MSKRLRTRGVTVAGVFADRQYAPAVVPRQQVSGLSFMPHTIQWTLGAYLCAHRRPTALLFQLRDDVFPQFRMLLVQLRFHFTDGWVAQVALTTKQTSVNGSKPNVSCVPMETSVQCHRKSIGPRDSKCSSDIKESVGQSHGLSTSTDGNDATPNMTTSTTKFVPNKKLS